MAIYSRYSAVLDNDGRAMTVREALQAINTELDANFNEQDGAVDPGTAFCLAIYTQCGYSAMQFGEAMVLATAKNTTPDAMREIGAMDASKGRVRLLVRDEVSSDVGDGAVAWLLAQQFTRTMETDGITGCAKLLHWMRDNVRGADAAAENARALAYRLYTIAEKKGDADEAFAYNALVSAWNDIKIKESKTPTETKMLSDALADKPKRGRRKKTGSGEGQGELF